ncbi:23S rRNA (guanosine(2251)-2'-O)-methyltransferase RlmB [bacterium]|nr:23S rRNA (guanosine(2251)-2'-O)-methyltransferase RlmB [bacterium]
MKKEHGPLETTSLSAIEHLLQHRPELIRSLRVAARPSARVDRIETLAKEQGVRPTRDPGLDSGESAVALLIAPPPVELKSLLSSVESKKRALLVALDHIQDPQNLGALCRSAEALGADALLLPKHRSATVTGTVFAASAGAAGTLPICTPSGLNEALRQCKEAGFWIVGSTLAEDSTPLEKMPDFEKVVLVLGAEGEGMSELTEKLCDWKVQIPLRGLVQSLNVSAAGAVLIYEILKRSGKE